MTRTLTLKSVLKDLNSEDGEFQKNVNSIIEKGFGLKKHLIELLIQYFINIGCRVIGKKIYVELGPSEYDNLILKPELSEFSNYSDYIRVGTGGFVDMVIKTPTGKIFNIVVDSTVRIHKLFRLVYLKEVEKEGVILFTFMNSKNPLLNYHKKYFGNVFSNNNGLLHQSRSHFLRRLKPKLLDFYKIPRVNLSMGKKKYLEETKKIKEKKFDYSELTNLKNLIVLYDEEKKKIIQKIDQSLEFTLTSKEKGFLTQMRNKINSLESLPVLISIKQYDFLLGIFSRKLITKNPQKQNKPTKKIFEHSHDIRDEIDTIKKIRITTKFSKDIENKNYLIKGHGRENMLKRIFVSLMNDKINGWEMSFLQKIQKIIEYTKDESVPITLKRYYRLEQIFEKTNIYTEDIKDLSWEDIKGKYKDL